MTRKIVKRSDRAKAIAAKWNSTEPYRDGLTYREWMRAHAKAQRKRELARAPGGDGAEDVVQHGGAAPDVSSDPVAVRKHPGESDQHGDCAGEPEGKEDRIKESREEGHGRMVPPAPSSAVTAQKKTTWGLRRWRAR